MTNNKKILMGILAFAPIIFFIIYGIFMIGIFGTIMDATSDPSMLSSSRNPLGNFPFKTMMTLLASFMIISLISLVVYIVDILNNEKLKADQNNKIMWLVLVILIGFIGRIVYFFVEVYPRPTV